MNSYMVHHKHDRVNLLNMASHMHNTEHGDSNHVTFVSIFVQVYYGWWLGHHLPILESWSETTYYVTAHCCIHHLMTAWIVLCYLNILYNENCSLIYSMQSGGSYPQLFTERDAFCRGFFLKTAGSFILVNTVHHYYSTQWLAQQ